MPDVRNTLAQYYLQDYVKNWLEQVDLTQFGIVQLNPVQSIGQLPKRSQMDQLGAAFSLFV
jgi:hypothetical protein